MTLLAGLPTWELSFGSSRYNLRRSTFHWSFDIDGAQGQAGNARNGEGFATHCAPGTSPEIASPELSAATQG